MKPLLFSLFFTLPALALESIPTKFDTFFHEGDTVAFLGDSITHGSDYHALVQTFFSTRYPELDLWTENVGRSGDTSWGTLSSRLDGDLYTFAPDSVILHFGMNDVGRDTFKGMKDAPSDESRAKRRGQYQQAMTKLVDILLEKKFRVAIMSPTLFDDTLNRWDNQNESPHLNGELAKFGEIGYTLAKEKNLPFIDVHSDLTRITNEKQAEKDSFSFTADRVHPQNGGYPIMAWKILKDFGADPIVYDVAIAADGKIETSDHAKISDLKRDGKTLTWNSTESRLPFPVKKKGHDTAFDLVGFQEELNLMNLKITGLEAGDYLLKIDDIEVGKFSADDLTAGLNLAANQATPQYAEAMKLRNGLIAEKLKLQALLRDLNSYRLNLLDQAKTYPELLKVDWNDPDAEAVIAIRDQQVAAMQAAKKNTGSYFGHITNQGKKYLGKTKEMKERLAEIRTELADLPTSRSYNYVLERQ